jgi:hyperosmotically inducible periplasmic protein
MGAKMKMNHAKIALAGMLVALAAAGAHAQNNDAAQTAASASSAKAGKEADRALQKAVLRALSQTRGVRVSTITVRAHDGVVTLEGNVPDESQVELATKAAQSVPGVTQVKNALTLSSI